MLFLALVSLGLSCFYFAVAASPRLLNGSSRIATPGYLQNRSLFLLFFPFSGLIDNPTSFGSITTMVHLKTLGHSHCCFQAFLNVGAHMLLQIGLNIGRECRKCLFVCHPRKAILQFLKYLYVCPAPAGMLKSVQVCFKLPRLV